MSVKLKPNYLDDNTVIYIEATEEVEVSPTNEPQNSSNDPDKVPISTKGVKEDFQKHIQDFQSTIFTYTSYTLAAFKKVAVADINKVTLEFGLEIGGEAGVPYITKGTVKSNLKVTVECNFTKDK